MKIMHLSDLHFGTEILTQLRELTDDIQNFFPDVVVISGDLTQRARKKQYQAVQQFITKIPVPVLTVPGNHDIPLYNIFMRLLFPFKNYQHWIEKKLCSHLEFNQAVILGINSATPYKPMGGYITDEQLNRVGKFFAAQPKEKKRIVVMHHNLIASARHKIINDAEKIINVFAKSNVSLVLSGHIHEPHVEKLKYNFLLSPMYIVTAGTAISARTAAPNSYNIIEIVDQGLKIIVRNFSDDKFITASETNYPL